MLKRWYVITGITLAGLAACFLLVMAGAVVGGLAGYAAAHRGPSVRLPEAWQEFGPQLRPREEAPELRPQIPELWQVPPEMMPERFAGQLRGALIVEVESGGPADQAGMETGDIIIAVNSKAMDVDHNLPDLIQSQEPGDDIVLTIVRYDDETEIVELEVTLGSDTTEEGEVVAHLGARYRPLTSGISLTPLERVPRFDRGTRPE